MHHRRILIVLKLDIIGTFHNVSAKYLLLCVAEFEWRYNNRDTIFLPGRIDRAGLAAVLFLALVRLYRALLYSDAGSDGALGWIGESRVQYH